MKPTRNTILSSGAVLGVALLLIAAAGSNATGADAAQASAPTAPASAPTNVAIVPPAGGGTTLPALSPSLPFDVTANPPFTLESLQTDFDVLSWQTFVAMNWPVLPNGQPNPAQRPGQNKDNATVWEMWRESSTIFLPGGATPAPWGSPLPPSSLLPPACRGLLKPGMHLLTQIGKTPGLLTEAVQPFNTGPLIDQNGRYARFEILVNQSMFNTIFTGKLYNKQAQQSVTSVVFDCGDQTAKQVGAIMVKAAWKILSPAEIAGGRFHTVQAVIYTPPSTNPVIAEKCETATVGLVGLHVVHKTKGAPQWVWSTFEHVDNCPTNGEVADHPGYSFFNKNDPAAPLNTPPPRPWNPTNTEPPARRPQIERMIPIDAATRQLNASWQAALRAVNPASVWQYYELVSTQWPTAPASGCDVATSAPANMSGAPAPQFLGNSTLESYIQGKVPNVSSSCIECHLNATTTTHTFSDFTYLLERAQ